MPVERPKVAVLLAAFNGMQWIEEQLASILEQLAVDVTIFISIDRSCDGTKAFCIDYSARHASVQVLPDAGSFGGASRNFFRLVRDVDFHDFDYIAFADQDDVWYPDKLQRATCFIQGHEVEAYSSNVTAFWSSGDTHLLNKAQPQVAWDFLFEAAGPGCTYVMSRELAEALKVSIIANWQRMQNVTLHDWYCYAFARSRGYRWYIDPEPSMDYRQHERNQVGANKGLNSLVVRYKTIHDGWWFRQVQLIACLVGVKNEPFVKPWFGLQRRHLVKLSFSAWSCRRRLRDKVFFFFVCWITAILGRKTG